MAQDDTNGGWETAPQGASSLSTKMLLNDAALQANHPNWPTGGTSQQLRQESNYNPNAVGPETKAGTAKGMVQATDVTKAAVEQQLGRKLDFSNVDDQLLFHRYLMNQNLDRTNGDPKGALSLYNSGRATPDNPETRNYVNTFNQKLPVDSPNNDTGWESAPAQQSNTGGWESAPVKQPSAANQRGQAALAAMHPDTQAIGNAVTGVGETAAQMATGMFGQAAGALHGAADLATGQSYEQAKADLNKEREAVTYQPRTEAGQQISQNFGNAMDKYLTQPLEQGGQAVGEAFGFSPEASKAGAEIGTSLFENLGLPGLLHGIGRGTSVEALGAPGEAAGKLAPVDEAVAPSAFMGPPRNTNIGPNEGVPRPPISVNNQGLAIDPTQEVTSEMLGAEMGRQRQQSAEQQAAGDLFPESLRDTTGQAEPYNPNREALVSPVEPETMQGQGRLQLDPLQDRMQALRDATPEQMDIFSDTPADHLDQFATEPETRSLTQEEFQQTVSDLAAKDGTRFPLPEDMDQAYSRYLDTVRDDQGGLFDRASMAKNFAESAVDEALDRRVAEHPTVKANQARVDDLQAQLANMQAVDSRAASMRPLQGRLEDAQRLLQKSQDNIKKVFEPAAKAAAPFYAADGTVHMYTFGYLPEMMKSIGALLKGIHGVVFKTLDKMIPSFKNLDTPGKMFGQGIKDFVNKQATRDWSQTVNEKPISQLGKIPGLRDAVTELNPHAQDEISPEELKNQFNTAPDLTDSKVGNFLRSNVLQGGLMLSDFSRHPLVKYVTDAVAKSFRASDKWTRENLLNPKNGLGPMIKRMDTQSFTEIRSLMEAYEGVKEFTANELRGRGFSDKQIEYYTRSLELQKESFTKFNAGRVAAGLPAIDPRIAHIAAYFTGDFKQIVKDSGGRIIAVLGNNNRAALGVIAKRFQELHPDGATLDMGKPELRRSTGDDNTFNGYMNILDHLSKNNADIQRLVDVYRDTQMANTNKLSQMANRGKFKSNPSGTVGGAEGSKLWQSMQQNAVDGGKQQLKYLESVNRWSEFQKAISKSQDFIKDPEVNAPNAKAVSQRYLDDQMHRNLGDLNKFTNSFMNGVADITGVGPSQMRGIANLTKTGLLNMFVGLGKFSHSLVTIMQPFIGSPEVNSVLKARGADLGLSQATSLFKSMMSNKDILQSMATKEPIKDPFVRAANAYAKANDTFNTSQFQMGSVTHPATKLGTALHINVTVPESGARAFTYMYYAHMLKDASDRAPVGDKLSDTEIFGSAHNAVQKVMADYNREAQAPIFSKMGFLGDLTRMLTTFKMNQISQAATATKMMTQGSVMPMVTMLASSLAASGLRGFIGYNIANGALGQLTTWATNQGIMKQPTNLDQIILHMLHGMNPHLADALNFGATSGLGIDMTGSLSHADDIPDDPLGTLIPEGGTIGKALGSAVQFAEHPNAQRGKAALYDVLPNSMKGVMENAAYTDEKGNYYDPHTGNLVANRSPTDQAKRAFSFRPLEESKMRLQAETGRGQNEQLNAVKSEIQKRLLSDADSKSLDAGKFQEYAKQYVAAGGNPQELVQQLVTHQGINKNLNIEQREAGLARGMTGAERYVRAQELK